MTNDLGAGHLSSVIRHPDKKNGARMSNRPWLAAYPQGVPTDIDTSAYGSLVQLMEESFQKYAARPAYVFLGKEFSYGQVDSLSRAFAAYLQGLGLVKGD